MPLLELKLRRQDELKNRLLTHLHLYQIIMYILGHKGRVDQYIKQGILVRIHMTQMNLDSSKLASEFSGFKSNFNSASQ